MLAWETEARGLMRVGAGPCWGSDSYSGIFGGLSGTGYPGPVTISISIVPTSPSSLPRIPRCRGLADPHPSVPPHPEHPPAPPAAIPLRRPFRDWALAAWLGNTLKIELEGSVRAGRAVWRHRHPFGVGTSRPRCFRIIFAGFSSVPDDA